MRGLMKSVTLAFCLLVMFGANANAKIKFKHYLRFEYEGTISYGELKAGWVYELTAAPFDGGEFTGKQYKPTSVTLLAPVLPNQVFAVGTNYESHTKDSTTAEPAVFSTLPNSIFGPSDPIPKSSNDTKLKYEGEMVIVIGKQAKNISKEDALDYVFGVTAGNDISQQSWQATDLQWLRVKGSDGFGPIGPVIVTGLNYDKLYLETRVNGDVVQAESTSGMTRDIATIVSAASQHFTLEPGDIIFTGTSGSTGPLKIGDRVVVTLEGVGGLSNTIEAAK